MKASNYNYIFYKDGRSYWYNGISKKFFRVSEKLGKTLNLIMNSGDISALPDEILAKFKSNSFILPKEADELEIIRTKDREEIQRKDYFLVILPTLNCNFECWYCIQHHIPSIMSESTKDALMKHIRYMVETDKITSLHIEWFGGEPFMGFKNVIVPVSEFARDLCDRAGIPFFNTATTNGYFLTPDKYKKMKDIRMSRFQITFDGNRESHNKVKYPSNDQSGKISAFDTTLGNISGYLGYNPEAILKLRINYTHENLTHDIPGQVMEYFPTETRERVHVTLKKVWQESTDKNFYSKTLDIQNSFLRNGFPVNTLDIIHNFVACYANRKYYASFNYDGGLLKCTASDDLYREEPLGRLNPDGSLSWNEGIEEGYQEAAFENGRCLACSYLPICMGQCPRNHIMKATECKFDCMDINIEEGIVNLIDEYYETSTP